MLKLPGMEWRYCSQEKMMVFIVSCICCCCSIAKSCPALGDPMDCSAPPPPSGFPVLNYLPEFAQVHVHWVSPSIKERFSNELVLHIRWPKFWSFSISPSSEYSGLISFSIDWFHLLIVAYILEPRISYSRPDLPHEITMCLKFLIIILLCFISQAEICNLNYVTCLIPHLKQFNHISQALSRAPAKPG